MLNGCRKTVLLASFFLICLVARGWAQTGIVQGKVTDVDGDPIAGATVWLDANAVSQTTDQNGEYRIDEILEGWEKAPTW